MYGFPSFSSQLEGLPEKPKGTRSKATTLTVPPAQGPLCPEDSVAEEVPRQATPAAVSAAAVAGSIC